MNTQRTLKFRIWSEKEKSFKLFDFANMLDCSGKIKHHVGTPTFVELLDRDGDWIFEQFTGLKDKNGIEIFEGDAIKISGSLSEDSTSCWKIGIVEWDSETLGYSVDSKWQNSWETGATSTSIHASGYFHEVLGNVHENPELLSQITT